MLSVVPSGWCEVGGDRMSIVVVHMVDRLCTVDVSSLWMLEAVRGSQMILVYSRMGRTS